MTLQTGNDFIKFDKLIPMKKLLVVSLALLGFALSGFSQVKKAVQTVTIKTPTVQCGMCKKTIEEYMIRETGVQKVTVDYKKKLTKVTYVSARTNIENIKTGIANAGYDADDITANEDSYKELPKCCKKPEDGGGVKKLQ